MSRPLRLAPATFPTFPALPTFATFPFTGCNLRHTAPQTTYAGFLSFFSRILAYSSAVRSYESSGTDALSDHVRGLVTRCVRDRGNPRDCWIKVMTASAQVDDEVYGKLLELPRAAAGLGAAESVDAASSALQEARSAAAQGQERTAAGLQSPAPLARTSVVGSLDDPQRVVEGRSPLLGLAVARLGIECDPASTGMDLVTLRDQVSGVYGAQRGSEQRAILRMTLNSLFHACAAKWTLRYGGAAYDGSSLGNMRFDEVAAKELIGHYGRVQDDQLIADTAAVKEWIEDNSIQVTLIARALCRRGHPCKWFEVRNATRWATGPPRLIGPSCG